MKKPSITLVPDVSVAALVEKIPAMKAPLLSKEQAHALQAFKSATNEKIQADMPRSVFLMANILSDIAEQNYQVPVPHLKIEYTVADCVEHTLEFSYTRPDAIVPNYENFSSYQLNHGICAMLNHLEKYHDGDNGVVFYPEDLSIVFTDKTALLIALGEYIYDQKNQLCTPDLIDLVDPLTRKEKKEGFDFHQAVREKMSYHAQMMQKCVDDKDSPELNADTFLKIMPVRSYLSMEHYKATANLALCTNIQISLDHISKVIDHEDNVDPSPQKIREFNQGGYN